MFCFETISILEQVNLYTAVQVRLAPSAPPEHLRSRFSQLACTGHIIGLLLRALYLSHTHTQLKPSPHHNTTLAASPHPTSLPLITSASLRLHQFHLRSHPHPLVCLLAVHISKNINAHANHTTSLHIHRPEPISRLSTPPETSPSASSLPSRWRPKSHPCPTATMRLSSTASTSSKPTTPTHQTTTKPLLPPTAPRRPQTPSLRSPRTRWDGTLSSSTTPPLAAHPRSST